MDRQPQSVSKGHSLAEMLIASTVLALVLGTLVYILWPAFRISARESVRADLMTQATLALTHLQKNLTGATLEGIVIHKPDSDTRYISVHGLGTVASDGSPVYAVNASLYAWHKPILKEFVHKPATSTPFRPTLPECIALESASPRRQFSQQVSEFEIVDGDPTTPVLELPLKVHLKLEKKAVANSPPETISLERSLFLPKR
jgi:type II secretory pathway component PulJ